MTISVFPKVIRDGLVVDFDPAYNTSFDSRENRFTYSQTFDNAAWASTEMNVTPSAGIAPDGTSTAYRLAPSVNALSHYLRQGGGISTTDVYTVSIYARAAGYNFFAIISSAYNACFNLQTGVVAATSGSGISANIVNVGNGWYRCSITVSTASNTFYFLSRATQGSAFDSTAGDGTSGALIWGAQMEKTRAVSAYTVTTTAAITRSATVTNTVSALYPGTINGVVQYHPLGQGSFYFDNTAGNFISFYTIPDTFWNASSWSVSSWVRGDVIKSDNAVLGHGSVVGNGGLHLGIRNANPYFGFFGNDWAGPAIISANIWYHIVWTYDNAQKQKTIFVDGVQVAQMSLTGGVGYIGTGSNTEIGRYPWDVGYRMQGYIGRTQIYNRVLAAPEVSQIYSSLAGRHG